MKKIVKRFLSYVLCACLCMTVLPVFAEGETNATDITFTAALDKTLIYESGIDQTVVLTVNADQPVTLAAIGATIEGASPLVLTAITNTDSRIDFAGNINVDTGKIDWYDSQLAVLEAVTNIVVATFTVPADTEAGSYELSVKDLILLDGQGTPIVNGVNVTASLEVKELETAAGYTAGISASENSMEVDDSVNVLVTAGHASTEAFAAAEITVSFDSSVLSFDAEAFKTSYPSVSADTTVAGTLKLVDHGESKSFGETGYVYTLPFKATVAADNTNVTLGYAGFATQTEAETKDLIEASYNPKSVTLNISEKSLSVTLPEGGILTGAAEVAYGGDYTFALADKDNYDYEITKVMMGNTDVTANLVNNGDGTYTIPSVTGALTITATRTAKQYSVTLDDTEIGKGTVTIETGEDKVIYGKDFTFNITPENNYAYVVTYTIAENTIELTAGENNTYIIPGNVITGDITVKIVGDNTIANVEVAGNGADAAKGYVTTVKKGETYTLSITPEAGYAADSYVVTATMENAKGVPEEITLSVADYTYTTPVVTGKLVFTITVDIDTSGISVSEYVQLDGAIMWLVENTTKVSNGKVPTYDGQNMFWSSKYGMDAENAGTNDGAYCYLVVAETLSVENAKDKLDITSGSVTSVAYDNDVNKTVKVDASDAQLVWNMYNSVYDNFTNDVTVAKFLEADVNGNKIVNMDDAVAVVAAALARTE